MEWQITHFSGDTTKIYHTASTATDLLTAINGATGGLITYAADGTTFSKLVMLDYIKESVITKYIDPSDPIMI